MPVHLFEAVCSLLPYFALAGCFQEYRDAGRIVLAILLLAALAALILERYKNTAVRILCGLLPALGLFAAETPEQILFTAPALILWLALSVSGKNVIYYQDYKYWFGIPAIAALVILFVNLPIAVDERPVSRLSILCASAYLACGILVLRRKRMGEGVGRVSRLMNIAEVTGALLCGMLACALLWELIVLSKGLMELLLFPLGLLMNAGIRLIIWITTPIFESQPKEEPPALEPEPQIGMKTADLKPETPKTEAVSYAWMEILERAVVVILILALFILILWLIRKAIRHLRAGGRADGSRYEDAVGGYSAFGRAERKKRKRKESAPSDQIREIYREYLCYIRLNGVRIARQTTSEDILAASKQLADSNEAAELRALYIRARYHDADPLSDEEARRAQALWDAIRVRFEAEKKYRYEETARLKQQT